MEDNIQETSQSPQQPIQEKRKDLMPGQEHEDELDLIGATLVNGIPRFFEWIKQLFAPKQS